MSFNAILKPVAKVVAKGGARRVLGNLADRFQINRNGENAARFPYVKRRAKRNCQILAYHRVNNENDAFFPGLPVRQFERQMEALANDFDLYHLSELAQRIEQDDIPENAIAVTFDDGYLDNYLNAFPILKKYSVPATIFLATGVIGSDKKLWHDRVFAAFNASTVRVLKGFGSGDSVYALDSLANKIIAQKHVLEHLWSLKPQDRDDTVGRLCVCLEVSELSSERCRRLMLSWEEIFEMSQYGVSFGAHTVNHPILSRLNGAEARGEILGSKTAIEKQLHVPVSSFAYPVGRRDDFTLETKEIVREAGFRCGVTMVLGNNEAGIDPFELRRIAPWDEEAEIFSLRLSALKFSA